MSNRAIWNVRLRHVWLATPLKGKRMKKRVLVLDHGQLADDISPEDLADA